MTKLYKYPKTFHINGSKGMDEGEPFSSILDKLLVVEEKMEGSNSAVSFDNGKLLLQSRGHYLSGGPKEAQFSMFKAWAWERHDWLYKVLGDRYVMFGEWLQAKHTLFYDALPSYFMEFDVLDKKNNEFLSTFRRRKLLLNYPSIIHPVRVLFTGRIKTKEQLLGLIGPSAFMTEDWESNLRKQHDKSKDTRDFDDILKETDRTGLMEGLYIKVEGEYYGDIFDEYNEVMERYKFVRKDFLDVVKESGSHWFGRPLIRNVIKSS